ncbi:MAG: FeoC-like transcriptional regulator [Candidatus Promineifilaceae bacterium]
MLKLVLQTIESSKGPVRVSELSQRLGIERGALEGMIDYWVQKGRLYDSDGAACAPSGSGCGSSCSGAARCSFIAKMPKMYEVRGE